MTLFVPVFAGILRQAVTVTSAVSYQTAVVALADGVMQMITRVLLPFCTMGFHWQSWMPSVRLCPWADCCGCPGSLPPGCWGC